MSFIGDFLAPWRKASFASQATSSRGLAELAREISSEQSGGLGPGVPNAPFHPETVEPRRYDYPIGYNIQQRPRAYERVDFPTLRSLADSYDVARLCIEKRKDELRRLEWAIRPKAVPDMSRDEAKARADRLAGAVARVTGFLLTPNQEDQWSTWLGQWAEDLFVIDAATVQLRPTRSGELYALELIDGATIRPIIDAYGRQPVPPEPAFGQVIRGITWTMFTREEMLYAPYWQRTASPYGHPPLEWVLIAVNRALRRQTMDLANFTDGTMPAAFYRVAADLPATQLRELQALMDELLAGNDAARSRVRLMPGGPGTGLDRVHPEPTTDGERWLMHLTCAAFGVNPSEIGFVEPGSGLGGKGFADTARDTSARREIGVANHLKSTIDGVIAGPLGEPELELVWPNLEQTEDRLVVAQAYQIWLDTGVVSGDEVRTDVLDLDPIGLPAYIKTGTGLTLVSDLAGAASATGDDASEASVQAETPSSEPGVETAGGTSVTEKAADIRRWQTKALRAVRDGRDPARFDSTAIDAETAAFLRDALAKVHTADDVREAFDLAKAGASAGPFAPVTAPASSAGSGSSSRRSSDARAATWYARWD